MERIDSKRLEEWHMQLDAPLPWEAESSTTTELWSEEDEAATFMKAMGG